MTEKTNARIFLGLARSLPVIDVRSPAEYLKGHIPGAINIPLFDDEERAIVGTLYAGSGREASVFKGIEMTGPKLASFVKTLHSRVRGREILMHCWRGGMRSEGMAWLFSLAGYHVRLLEGGYKEYRRTIRSGFGEKIPFIVLGGLTGSGKSELLCHLGKLGEQVLDLEKIACHKGSVFGGLGQESQPTNEQFENNLYSEWEMLDPSKPVWIEDESRMIGNVSIPYPLFKQMNRSDMIRTDVPVEIRIRRLVSLYSGFGEEKLGEAIQKISEKLGGTRTQQAMEALRRGEYAAVTEIVLGHYDKSYEHAISRRQSKEIHTLILNDTDPVHNARSLKEFAKNLFSKR